MAGPFSADMAAEGEGGERRRASRERERWNRAEEKRKRVECTRRRWELAAEGSVQRAEVSDRGERARER